MKTHPKQIQWRPSYTFSRLQRAPRDGARNDTQAVIPGCSPAPKPRLDSLHRRIGLWRVVRRRRRGLRYRRRVHGERKARIGWGAPIRGLCGSVELRPIPEGLGEVQKTRKPSLDALPIPYIAVPIRHWSGENVCMYARLLDQADETIAERRNALTSRI